MSDQNLYYVSWLNSSNNKQILIINADSKDKAEAKLRAWSMVNKDKEPMCYTLRRLVVKDCLLLTCRD